MLVAFVAACTFVTAIGSRVPSTGTVKVAVEPSTIVTARSPAPPIHNQRIAGLYVVLSSGTISITDVPTASGAPGGSGCNLVHHPAGQHQHANGHELHHCGMQLWAFIEGCIVEHDVLSGNDFDRALAVDHQLACFGGNPLMPHVDDRWRRCVGVEYADQFITMAVISSPCSGSC